MGAGVPAPPTRGQPRKYSARNLGTGCRVTWWNDRARFGSRMAARRADDHDMRALLELLGIVPPDPSRREPIALPAYLRWITLALVAVVTIASLLVSALARILLG